MVAIVDVTWFVPVVILLLGAVAVLVVVRQLAQASAELEASRRRFQRIEEALIPLRVEARRTRASNDHLHHR